MDRALSGVNKEIRDTQSELKDVEKLLKMDPGNTELLRQKYDPVSYTHLKEFLARQRQMAKDTERDDMEQHCSHRAMEWGQRPGYPDTPCLLYTSRCV